MKHALTAITGALVLSGCASIFSGSTQQVTITSQPPGANISVANSAGATVHTATTPATLTLNRGAGYFRSESYKVVVQKEGFAPKELTLTASLNGWYLGNILFGGLIGMLAVDPVTGAMYSFPDSVSATLEAQGGKAAAAAGSLTVVSTESLSAEQMKQARLVGAL